MKIENNHKEPIDIHIINYLSNNINPEDKEYLLKWIDESESNYTHFANLKNLWDNTYTPFSADDIDVEEGLKKITQKTNRPQRFNAATWLLRIAAVMVLSLLSIGVYRYFQDENIQQEVYQEVFAPYGTYSNVQLPDGSIVYLNSGSQIGRAHV